MASFAATFPASPSFIPLPTGPRPFLQPHPASELQAETPRLPLSRERELLAREREQLALEHLSTVRYVARRVHERLPQHVEFEELVSAGTVGLLDACARFDFTKQVQFKTYAQFRIRGAILDSLRTLDWSPRELRRRGREVEEASRVLLQRLGRTPSETEIAAELELSLEQLQHLLNDLKGLEIGSLNVEHHEDSGDDELACLPADSKEDPLLKFLDSERRERLMHALDVLPEKERMVLTLYYFEEITMKEIGQALGVVESRVSQIHSAAVKRLRAALGAEAGTATPARPKPAKRPRRMRTRRIPHALPKAA